MPGSTGTASLLRSQAFPLSAQVVARATTPGSIDPSDWHAMAKWARDNDRGRLSDKERAFVHDLAAPLRFRRGFHPTVKQAEWLRAIFLNLVRWVP